MKLTYKQKYLLALLILCLCVLAWMSRFIQDDAFISMRYAKNLAEGNGLVFNNGERVEGYTNFLWTIILTIPHLLKIDPVLFASILGIILFGFSLLCVFKISTLFTNNTVFCFLTVIFTGTNYTFLCYATGGLETQLSAFLLLASVLLSLRIKQDSGYKNLLLLSFLLTAQFLTRPDTVVFIALIILYIFSKIFNDKYRLRKITVLIIPFMVFSMVYLWLKFNFYGEVIPNTVYAKVFSNTSPEYGVYYIYKFFASYWLAIFPLLMILVFAYKKIFDINILYLAAIIFCTILFVVYVGGDFMEFRLLVPVIPLFFILVIKLFELLNSYIISTILSIVIIAGSVSHAITYKSNNDLKLLSIDELRSQITAKNFNWAGIGKKLNKYFPHEDIIISTTAAGAIPYYSSLPAVDMHGLTDKWIARHGDIISDRPGHQRLAPFWYLQQKKVNILIGHPFVSWKSFTLDKITQSQVKTFFMYDYRQLPGDAFIVKMPVEHGYFLVFIYLNSNEKIDQVIASGKWDRIKLSELEK